MPQTYAGAAWCTARRIAPLLMLLVIAVALAGCGKKGPPQAPPDAPDTFPRSYPNV